MEVTFIITKTNKKWQSELHQLNSNLLLKHIHYFGELNEFNLSLTYSEDTQSGTILNRAGTTLGQFYILDNDIRH
ncbi:hypothetical protein RCJ22_13815 [Vibrio sp. FNV 38]|nr:hypothetical protein [Vibrio sp. FNV 38]